MSLRTWLREQAELTQAARRFFSFGSARALNLNRDVERPPAPETLWPDGRFERYCPAHDEKLNWLLCPKGHQLTSADDWLVKDEVTGRVIETARDNDGTQRWQGYAPRH